MKLILALVLAGLLGVISPALADNNSYTWTQLGPAGGWIASIAFNPAQAGEIWASGDDASGIYRSLDGGATWTLFTNMPANPSTYCLTIDPTQPGRVYAPNHFGRGMLLTRDGGQSWSQAATGLPSPDAPNKRIFDLSINPLNGNVLFAASDAGLFKSSDAGTTFQPVTSTVFAGQSQFLSLAHAPGGRLFAGTSGGGVFSSPDQGGTWNVILAPTSGVPIPTLAATANALYIGGLTADVFKVLAPDFSPASLAWINHGDGSGAFVTGLKLKLCAVSGNSANADTVFVGTSAATSAAAAQWGVHKSTDGGQTFVQKVAGLAGISIFSLAVNPADPSQVAAATLGDGVYVSTDGAEHWAASTQRGLAATTSLGLAQDTRNPLHFVLSCTAGVLGKNYETFDNGFSWSVFSDPAPGNDVLAFDLDPGASATVLAGTFGAGAFRSVNGSAGPWVQVIPSPLKIERFVRESQNSQALYAVATGPAGNPAAALYASLDGGTHFAMRNTLLYHLATHPSRAGEAVGVRDDAYATQDSFATWVSLGLKAYASPAEGGFTAVAFDAGNTSTVLVGGAHAGLYLTRDYAPGNSAIVWTKIPSPMQGGPIRDLVIVPRPDAPSIWYASVFGGDVFFNSTTTPGVFRSIDEGASWTPLSHGMFPCSIPWSFFRSAAIPGRYYAAMWGGGLLALDDVFTANPGLAVKENQVLAFPNPARNKVAFLMNLPESAAVKIVIYNFHGEKIAEVKGTLAAGRQSLVWDCAQAAAGVYLARATADAREVARTKFAVIR
jgi:hypothetical protein